MNNLVHVRGTWPERVQLKRGFGLAVARPWNESAEGVASLRLMRGSHSFLRACARTLAQRGVSMTRSTALPMTRTGIWKRAGFQPFAELVIFERNLLEPIPAPVVEITGVEDPDPSVLLPIDDAAFVPDWRLGVLGLEDAIAATAHRRVLIATDDDMPSGFAIVGESAGISYLQRLAVSPEKRGLGLGRSLLLSSMAWARSKGARTMVLNTQVDNSTAANLYISEGFSQAVMRLAVVQWNDPDGDRHSPAGSKETR